MLAKSKQVKTLRDAYLSLKKNKEAGQDHLRSLRLEIKGLQKSLKEEYRKWIGLSREVTELSS